MRASRSNSISSSSSLESADSAYRTISNPGTPRSALNEARSPYDPRFGMTAIATESRSPYRSVADTKQAFSPYRGSPLLSAMAQQGGAAVSGSLIPSPLAMDRSHVAEERQSHQGTDARKSLEQGTDNRKSTSSSPVLKTALSMPPLVGQEAWFHTPKKSSLTLPVASSSSTAMMARSMSQDTTMSEDIDVESIETDTAVQQQQSQQRSEEKMTDQQTSKVFKLKKSFLERFSPEPPSDVHAQSSAVERLKRSTASPAGSLPERFNTGSPLHDVSPPKRSKTASPKHFDDEADSRLSPSSLRNSLLFHGDQNNRNYFSSPPKKDAANAKESIRQASESSGQSSTRVQQEEEEEVGPLPALVPTTSIHAPTSLSSAALAGSQGMMNPFMANYPNPALLYQYAALQQLHNMQALQQQLQHQQR